jgi:hypothetical protein
MKKLLKNLAIGGLLMLSACGRNNDLESVTSAPYNAPVASSKGKESFEKLGEVSPNNVGYTLDMNGDGLEDFVILQNNIVYFKRGRGNGNFEREIPILTISDKVVAYRIGGVANQTKPPVVFFLEDGNGYFQPNLGSTPEGIPYFGEREATE